MTAAPRLAPPVFLGDPALLAVLDALPAARLVGGCVRDVLAGAPVADLDLATPDRPDAVLAALARAGLRGVPTGISHGTITAISGGRGFEVTTLRRDVQTDGRHAVVAFSDDWLEDARRRDFTFNAMSMTRDGAVFDYFSGIADLRAGRVRFVGDPATRIAEDRLRVLRYFRFFARFSAPAGAEPDAATAAALAAAAPLLPRLSAERIWAELKRILATPQPMTALKLMQGLGILAAILPQAGGLERLAGMIAAGAPADPVLRLAGLIEGDDAPLAVRLRLSLDEAGRLRQMRAAPVVAEAVDDAGLRRLLAEHARPALLGQAWLSHAPAPLLLRLETMPAPVFPLVGRDALGLGLPPGPAVGEALRQMRAWWTAGGCVASKADCRAELARIVQPGR